MMLFSMVLLERWNVKICNLEILQFVWHNLVPKLAPGLFQLVSGCVCVCVWGGGCGGGGESLRIKCFISVFLLSCLLGSLYFTVHST